jgi:hypothetical protein
MTRHFDSYTQARRELRSVLDTASTGRVTTVRRDQETFTVVDAGLLREQLTRLQPSRAVVAAEGGGWAAWIPGLPVHGEGDTFDDAIADLIDALREYAEDWNDRLLTAPNHRNSWALVELVELSSDEQLREWLLAAAAEPVLTAR